MKIVPRGERILVEKRDVSSHMQTASGLVLPTSALQRDTQYDVVAVGKGVTDISVGDVVVLTQYQGVKVNDSQTVVEAGDIVATIIY